MRICSRATPLFRITYTGPSALAMLACLFCAACPRWGRA